MIMFLVHVWSLKRTELKKLKLLAAEPGIKYNHFKSTVISISVYLLTCVRFNDYSCMISYSRFDDPDLNRVKIKEYYYTITG